MVRGMAVIKGILAQSVPSQLKHMTTRPKGRMCQILRSSQTHLKAQQTFESSMRG